MSTWSKAEAGRNCTPKLIAFHLWKISRALKTVLRSSAVDLSEGEDISEITHPVAESGNHGWRSKLPSEPQTGIAANEIVVTTREFELPV